MLQLGNAPRRRRQRDTYTPSLLSFFLFLFFFSSSPPSIRLRPNKVRRITPGGAPYVPRRPGCAVLDIYSVKLRREGLQISVDGGGPVGAHIDRCAAAAARSAVRLIRPGGAQVSGGQGLPGIRRSFELGWLNNRYAVR